MQNQFALHVKVDHKLKLTEMSQNNFGLLGSRFPFEVNRTTIISHKVIKHRHELKTRNLTVPTLEKNKINDVYKTLLMNHTVANF